MDVFTLRNNLIDDYSEYIKSFINISDPKISEKVYSELRDGYLWPEPLIQLNPFFEKGDSLNSLVKEGILHKSCEEIFRLKENSCDRGNPLPLYKHQVEAIRAYKSSGNFVLSTGTGSGKSLSYIIPIVDYVLSNPGKTGIKAIIVYPMNALANSQFGELEKYINWGFEKPLVTFERYTGQEDHDTRNRIINQPPDILLTNYVMLELIMTRPWEMPLIENSENFRFLVFDELHTYRGRQGADVSLLIRRFRERVKNKNFNCIGTSATLSSGGTFYDQQKEIAKVATMIFGSDFLPGNIIGETLVKVTPDIDIHTPDFIKKLKDSLKDQKINFPNNYYEFIQHPLSIWIENVFGVCKEESTGKLIRNIPISIKGPNGASEKLSKITDLSPEICADLIESCLMHGYSIRVESGKSPFVFKLHQFISRGESVYASIEPVKERYITLNGQHFVPGSRNKILLPVVFCRECGQEYYSVWKLQDKDTGNFSFHSRNYRDHESVDSGESGYLYLSETNPFPENPEDYQDRIPENWLEEYKGIFRVKNHNKKSIPVKYEINTTGQEDENGLSCSFIPGKFQFCLNCGVVHNPHLSSDFSKVNALDAGGRSTATTIITLSAIQNLNNQKELPEHAKKILGFTDNRQDASLQAGHFNDFVQITLLRSAVYSAVSKSVSGIEYDSLAESVFNSLNLNFEDYSSNPQAKYGVRTEIEQALQKVLGYHVYRDLRKGWRITLPNLEQCGLLKIEYKYLKEFCSNEDEWTHCHSALQTASIEVREKICYVLLDFMRRELALKVDFLDKKFQDRIASASFQHLISPWKLEEDEQKYLEKSRVLVTIPKKDVNHDYSTVHLTEKSGFGKYLSNRSTFNNYDLKISVEERKQIIENLLEALCVCGIIEKESYNTHKNEEPVNGYKLKASSMVWKSGDGKNAFHDPIRIPFSPDGGLKTNSYFVNFYKTIAINLKGITAREHTAQVSSQMREEREKLFREGALPIMFCSPTMELGVDISQLNTVYLRNIPPTPANYAQRSGRAGRSGQPAMVVSYCTKGNPHDQYYFRKPQLMVAGKVTAPRIELGNEDLVRAHIHAVWLAETKQSLHSSLHEILDVEKSKTTAVFNESFEKECFEKKGVVQNTYSGAFKVLSSFESILQETDWYDKDWLQSQIDRIRNRFMESCQRWLTLFNSATKQQEYHNSVSIDVTKSKKEKENAKNLRREAEKQRELLIGKQNFLSDFYSYRYFASEGFLPGYSFPRLPLSAFIDSGKGLSQKNDSGIYLSRGRFIAISEFGPFSIIYHEGSKFWINKVILDFSEKGELALINIKKCEQCGYIHPYTENKGHERCEKCNDILTDSNSHMMRMQNVSAARKDKINSDEEERVRLGYELSTGIRFPEKNGKILCKSAEVYDNSAKLIAKIHYASASEIWKINLGWSIRKNRNEKGFFLDTSNGYWSKKGGENIAEIETLSVPVEKELKRVIPYVTDRKNALIFEPLWELTHGKMASFQSALKSAIQIVYQLEDNELAVEPLPDRENRKNILIYEASEGGAGVLRHLIDDPKAISKIATVALELCHFDPDTLADVGGPNTNLKCDAACYNCLLSYYNQPDHEILDRKIIVDELNSLKNSTLKVSSDIMNRSDSFNNLISKCQTMLEKNWLKWIYDNNYNLPSNAQVLFSDEKAQPDFYYDKGNIAVFIDGPVHNYPDVSIRDKKAEDRLNCSGIESIRFTADNSTWKTTIEKYADVFGKGI